MSIGVPLAFSDIISFVKGIIFVGVRDAFHLLENESDKPKQ